MNHRKTVKFLSFGLFGLISLCGVIFLHYDKVPQKQKVEEDLVEADEAREESAHLNVTQPKAVAAGDVRHVLREPVGYAEAIQPTGTPSVEKSGVSRLIDLITGLGDATMSERFDAVIRVKNARLSDEDASRLLNYLADPSRYKGMNDSAMYAYVNELVSVFHDQDILDDRYLKVSQEVIFSSEDEVIRDYFVQGLSRGYERANTSQSSMIKDLFWKISHENNTSLAGTALHALNRARLYEGEAFSEAECEKLVLCVRRLFEDPESSERSRIPAIQIAVDLQMHELMDQMEVLLHSEDSTLSERVAALSSLARMGGTTQIQTMLDSDEPLLARAAEKLIYK
ncbi:MAG TPA: hypothetical protein DEA90_06175 [Opitutae bacterium]|nr:hypothetical protein [Puniceicoccaceae bacterium]HBR93733.1 hypothetical protein [Opitutae bacterium]|tara:strand:- start:9034 stop:10056 length:1023 start_codon:yes stop_codon:yes gene_type:complete